MPNATQLLSSADVCAALGIDRSTLTRWVQSGKVVPFQKLTGRTGAYLFTADEIDRVQDDIPRTP